MAIEVSKTGIDWVDKQLMDELANLKVGKFDKDLSIKHLNTVKNAESYSDMMKNNSAVTIMAVQILLKEIGYESIGKIDGILKTQGQATSKTMEAIKDFQRKNELTPDGAPGPDTVKKLLEQVENGKRIQETKTLEKQVQSDEVTLADLNFDSYSVGDFDENDNFVLKEGVEGSDSKGKYIGVNDKKLYELGDNKNGIYYKVSHNGYSGYLYCGQFINGEQEGRGKQLWSNGDKYDGQFKNGKMEGQGTYIWKDNGNKYVGELKDGEPWTGTIYDKDGKTVLEQVENGKRIQG